MCNTQYHIQTSVFCTVYLITTKQLPNTTHKLLSLSLSLYTPLYAWSSCAVSVWSSGSIFWHYSARKIWDTEHHLAWMGVKCNIWIHNRRRMHSIVHYVDYSLNKILFINHTHLQVLWEQTLWAPFYQLEILDPLMVAMTHRLSLHQSSPHLESVQPFVKQPAR